MSEVHRDFIYVLYLLINKHTKKIRKSPLDTGLNSRISEINGVKIDHY